MEQEQIISEISTLKERTKSHSRRLDEVEEKMDDLPDLKAMMNSVITTNEKQSETLEKINDNLTELSKGYHEMSSEQKLIAKEQKQMGERLGKLETSKIDWNEVFRATPGKVIPAVITGVVVTLILVWLGFK